MATSGAAGCGTRRLGRPILRSAWDSVTMSAAATLKVPGTSRRVDQKQGRDRIAGMQELQAGVEAHHPWHHRQR